MTDEYENLVCPVCLRETEEQVRSCAYCGRKYTRKHGLEEDAEEPPEDSPAAEGLVQALLKMGKEPDGRDR
mgnify:FL=1